MREEVRELLGRVAYEAVTPRLDDSDSVQRPWNEAAQGVQESYRLEAEAVVSALAMLLLPVFKNILAEDDIKQLLEQM